MSAADPIAAVREILLADEATAALVATRVYGGELPSDTNPLTLGGCIVLNPSGGPASPGSLGNYGITRLDALCYGQTPNQAWSVYLAVYAALKHAKAQVADNVLVKSIEVLAKGALGTDPITLFPCCAASFSVLASEVTSS